MDILGLKSAKGVVIVLIEKRDAKLIAPAHAKLIARAHLID
jgi:hypothetical protein